MKNWVIKHPIWSFVISTSAWSWTIWSFVFIWIKPGELLSGPPGIVFPFVILGGIGPSLAGIIITKIIYGKKGSQKLKARLKNWRVSWWWLAVLIIPVTTLGMPIIRSFYGIQIDWSGFAKLIGPGIGLGIVAGFMEEFGWRGFLLPHLLRKYSPFVATLMLGLIWGGIWHGYADYIGLGGQGLHSLWMIILLGPILLTAWSFILTWIYTRTKGSLLMSITMHFSISSSALIFGQKFASRNEELIWTSISVALATIVSAIIWLADRKAINSVPIKDNF